MSKLKIFLLVVLIFGAGFVGGVVTTRFVVRRMVTRAIAQPELMRMRLERELAWKLRLDPAQREKVSAIMQTAQGRIRGIRQEFQPQVVAVLNDASTEINATLTPEQQERFARFRAEHSGWLRQMPPPAR